MADVIASSLAELRKTVNLTTSRNVLDFKDIKYIPIDYESITELLVERLKARLPNQWTDFMESNYGMEILEAVAYESSMLAFLVNRNINEMFLPTAKTATSVYNLVDLIGYKPKGPTPANTLLRFYLDTPHDTLIEIPAYFPVGNGYYTTNECRIEPGQTSTTAYAIAGKIGIDKFVTTGNIKDVYTLRDSPVSFIEAVLVNGEKYEEKDFIDSLNDKKVFTVDYTNTFQASIKFGDGVYGENPKENLPLVVYYNVNEGAKSNAAANTITSLDEVVRDIEGKVVNVNVLNILAASGGANAESVSDVKRKAPSIFRTQYRAVTRQDFKDILLNIGYDKTTVLDRSVDKNIGIFGVKLAALNKNREQLTEAEKQDILDEIDRRRIIATQFEVIKPTIIPVNLSVRIIVDPAYVVDLVVAKAQKLLGEYLSVENREFGDIVSAVDIYTILNAIEGIKTAEGLKVEENRVSTVIETAEVGSKVLKIQDTGNFFTVGSYVSIIDDTNNITTVGLIEDINGEVFTFDRTITYAIPKDSKVYPVLQLKYDAALEDKEIYIESQGPIGEIANSIITFIDDGSAKEHVVMYRSFASVGKTGEKYRLTKALGQSYKAGSKFYIKKKNPYPIIDGTHPIGSNNLTFRTKPKFTPGAVLIPRKNLSYDIETRTMIRSFDNFDTLPGDIVISGVRRVFINPTTPFTEGVDYVINSNRTIIWLNKDAIPTNKQYYIDIVSVRSIEEISDVKYYVNSVSGYTASISPSLTVELEDGDILDVESESLNISEMEIADLGTVNIIAIQDT